MAQNIGPKNATTPAITADRGGRLQIDAYAILVRSTKQPSHLRHSFLFNEGRRAVAQDHFDFSIVFESALDQFL